MLPGLSATWQTYGPAPLTARGDYANRIGMNEYTLQDRVHAGKVVTHVGHDWSAAFDGPPCTEAALATPPGGVAFAASRRGGGVYVRSAGLLDVPGDAAAETTHRVTPIELLSAAAPLD